MKKMLVVYYSWSNGNTKRIAEQLADETGADIARIETTEPYRGSHEAVVDQGQREVEAGFTTTKSKYVNAPVINELPLTLECELIKVIDDSKYLAEIKNVSVDEAILGSDGEVSLEKFAPITFDTAHYGYYRLGERVGTAFKDGEQLK